MEMKKLSIIALFFLIILFPSITLAVVVDGYCYLQYQTNHSGTKVLFQADSPTAITDSTFTNVSGYYQINVNIGAYDIYFTHPGYYDYSILNQLCIQTLTLPTITLQAFPLGIWISGSLSGILTDTTYVVMGDIWVAEGQSLIIEPGAILKFNGNYQFDIDGLLYCVGTENDSIKFDNYYSTGAHWNGIDFNPTADDSCLLKYCRITGSDDAGVFIDDSNPTIENCLITQNSGYNGGGIYFVGNSASLVKNCLFTGNTGAGSGIDCTSDSHPSVEDCSFKENYGNVISCRSSSYPSFYNCIVTINIATASASAVVVCDNNSHPEFNNCLIGANHTGMAFSGSSYPIVLNCTIAGNLGGTGLFIDEFSAPRIVNSIVYGNNIWGIFFSPYSHATIEYCDIFGNGFGNLGGAVPANLGVIVTTNANNDPCDIFFNISMNPLFVAPAQVNYYLTPNSPCIDAGNPLSPLDPDGTVADMGAYPFNHLIRPTITISGSDAILNWQEIEGLEEYRIYYSSNPYFIPSGIPQAVVLPPDTSWTDENAVNQGKRYYRIVVEY
jgi:hypothetical protein